jgi:two-component system phosphate regulon response regulator OmpR
MSPATAPVLADDAAHLLIIDDDARIRKLLHKYLGENGYRVTIASDAKDARAKLAGLAFDLLVLDVMMPGETGMEFIQDFRQTSDIPVIMLTALTETDHRIDGLEKGADDYLAKPFEPKELLLRVKNILKRKGNRNFNTVEIVRFGPYSYHVTKQELKNGEMGIKLTEREKELMTIFANRANSVVPRLELAESDTISSERTVDVQINRLRRKIEPDQTNPVFLQTVRGVGYRLLVD